MSTNLMTMDSYLGSVLIYFCGKILRHLLDFVSTFKKILFDMHSKSFLINCFRRDYKPRSCVSLLHTDHVNEVERFICVRLSLSSLFYRHIGPAIKTTTSFDSDHSTLQKLAFFMLWLYFDRINTVSNARMRCRVFESHFWNKLKVSGVLTKIESN